MRSIAPGYTVMAYGVAYGLGVREWRSGVALCYGVVLWRCVCGVDPLGVRVGVLWRGLALGYGVYVCGRRGAGVRCG